MSQNDHKLAGSVLSLCYFILVRDFYSRQERFDLKNTLMNFLKYAYVGLVTKQEKKLGKGQQFDFRVDNNIDTNICEWIIKIIQCLYYIEEYEQDDLLSDFCQEKKTSKFIDKQLIQENIQKKTIGKFKIEREIKLNNFLMEMVYPDNNDTYYLIEVLLINYMDLTKKVVELLYLIFSLKKNILCGLNNAILIDQNSFPNYNSFKSYYVKLHIAVSNLNLLKSDDSKNASNIYNQLTNIITDFIHMVFIKVDESEMDNVDKKDMKNGGNLPVIDELSVNNKNEDDYPLLKVNFKLPINIIF